MTIEQSPLMPPVGEIGEWFETRVFERLAKEPYRLHWCIGPAEFGSSIELVEDGAESICLQFDQVGGVKVVLDPVAGGFGPIHVSVEPGEVDAQGEELRTRLLRAARACAQRSLDDMMSKMYQVKTIVEAG